MVVDKDMRIAKSLWVFTTHKETIRRSTDEFIIDLFYHVDLVMGHQPKHVQATLSPSERVTLALLVALKGGAPGAFAPLAAPHLCDLVSGLAGAHPAVSARCCAPGLGRVRFGPPTVLGVADSYGIEVRHPWRTDRADRQIGGTTLSNHRWIVGAKLAYVVNQYQTSPCDVGHVCGPPLSVIVVG